MNILHTIQKELKAPKSNYNSFGKYKYRSCEDIVEGVKQVLPEGYALLLSDEIVLIGDRYYIKATAKLVGKDVNIEAYGYAREPETKKGMDESQITGTASSYARKYALNGLFAIDDTKDADTDEHKKQEQKDEWQPNEQFKTFLEMKNWALDFRKSIQDAKSIDELETLYKLDKNNVVKAGALDDTFKKLVKDAIGKQIKQLGD